MRRLEDSVGQPLFHRYGSGVKLTSTGERLLIHADHILNTHDEAIADLSGIELNGSISFGCPEDYLSAFLPDVLQSFSKLHPAVEIEIVCAPTVDLRPLLHRRQIEIALISIPDSAGMDVIRSESFVWITNAPNSRILSLDPLPLALSAPNTLDHHAVCSTMSQSGKRYRITFASNSLAGLIAVARSGQAISVVTRTAVPSDLFIIEEDLPPLPHIGITLAYASSQQSAAIKAFGKHIRSILPKL